MWVIGYERMEWFYRKKYIFKQGDEKSNCKLFFGSNVYRYFFSVSIIFSIIYGPGVEALERELKWRAISPFFSDWMPSGGGATSLIRSNFESNLGSPNSNGICWHTMNSCSNILATTLEGFKKITIQCDLQKYCPSSAGIPPSEVEPTPVTQTAGRAEGIPFAVSSSHENGGDCPKSDNPISFAKGNKFYQFDDYVSAGRFPLRFTRYYNSQYIDALPHSSISSFLPKWSHYYERKIKAGGNDDSVVLRRHDGRSFIYELEGTNWYSTFDPKGLLQTVKNSQNTIIQWRYTDKNGMTEVYDEDGYLIELIDTNGMSQTVVYALSSSLFDAFDSISVTDAAGQTLFIEYTDGQFSRLVTPANDEFQYLHSDGKLQSVIYPDQTSTDEDNPKHHFNYDSLNFTSAITEIRDHNNKVISRVSYDASLRASSSEKADGKEKVVVDYVSSTQVKVTNALAKETFYYFQALPANKRRLIRVEGIASTNCSGDNKYYTYESAEGRQISTSTDKMGNVTYYERDNRGRVTLKRSGYHWSSVPQSGTVSNVLSQLVAPLAPEVLEETRTCWHAFHSEPERIIEADRVTRYEYFSSGQLKKQTVEKRTPANDSCL